MKIGEQSGMQDRLGAKHYAGKERHIHTCDHALSRMKLESKREMTPPEKNTRLVSLQIRYPTPTSQLTRFSNRRRSRSMYINFETKTIPLLCCDRLCSTDIFRLFVCR